MATWPYFDILIISCIMFCLLKHLNIETKLTYFDKKKLNIQNNTLMFIKSFSNSTWKGSYRLRNHQVNQPTKLIPFVKFTTITYVIRNCILYTIIYLFPLSFCSPLQIETLKKNLLYELFFINRTQYWNTPTSK